MRRAAGEPYRLGLREGRLFVDDVHGLVGRDLARVPQIPARGGEDLRARGDDHPVRGLPFPLGFRSESPAQAGLPLVDAEGIYAVLAPQIDSGEIGGAVHAGKRPLQGGACRPMRSMNMSGLFTSWECAPAGLTSAPRGERVDPLRVIIEARNQLEFRAARLEEDRSPPHADLLDRLQAVRDERGAGDEESLDPQ